MTWRDILIFVGVTILISVASVIVSLWPEKQEHYCAYQMRDVSPQQKTEAYAAYDFGLRIQDAVRRKDRDALLVLMPQELVKGPTRAVIAQEKFNKVFSKAWRDEVLAEKPECTRLGWRGYMLESGLVWYDYDDEMSGFRITSINMLDEMHTQP